MENKIVIASQMLERSNVDDRPKILQSVYERFGAECKVFYFQALDSNDYKMRISGIKILVDLLDKDALKYLEPLKKDENFWVRRTANKYCKKISNENS